MDLKKKREATVIHSTTKKKSNVVRSRGEGQKADK
jgi:hypothetical protein